jgi:stage III sporulation protein AD
MEDMLKVAAGVLVAAMLTIILQGQGKAYVTLLIVAVATMGACIAFNYIKPIIAFLNRLQDVSNLKSETLTTLLKAVGIGVLNEFCGAICTDTGNTSLAKMLNLVSSVAIMWISLPVLEQIMELITHVLEGI